MQKEHLTKTQHLFLIKILSKLGIVGNFLKLIKGICEKSANMFNGETNTECFVPKIRNKRNISTLTASLQHCT